LADIPKTACHALLTMAAMLVYSLAGGCCHRMAQQKKERLPVVKATAQDFTGHHPAHADYNTPGSAVN
jgi:hypothetical protein